ncbi:MAG: hypothetical protein P1U56_17280 [Saprospiraceae bacterium]|nr:hypothetical protein [Saprospiraceae bacterium]
MNNVETINKIVMVIGILGIISGIIMAVKGSTFQDYFYGLFIGFTLLGTAYYNNKKWKESNQEKAENK